MSEAPSMPCDSPAGGAACSVSPAGLGGRIRSVCRTRSASALTPKCSKHNPICGGTSVTAADKRCAPRSVSRFRLGSRVCVRRHAVLWLAMAAVAFVGPSSSCREFRSNGTAQDECRVWCALFDHPTAVANYTLSDITAGPGGSINKLEADLVQLPAGFRSVGSVTPDESTLRDFRTKNSHPVRIQLSCCGRTDPGALPPFIWGRWYHNCTFSRVAFNPTVDQALAYVHRASGNGTGRGTWDEESWVLLLKQAGHWVVTGTVRARVAMS